MKNKKMMLHLGENMEKICKNCKYYKEKDNSCTCPKFVYMGNGEEIDYEGDEFGYEDCESYAANIAVGKKFGCVHFEEK